MAVVSFVYGSTRTAPGISSGLRTTCAYSGVTPMFGVLTTKTPRQFGASTSERLREYVSQCSLNRNMRHSAQLAGILKLQVNEV